ncbi:excinuclease ABC subunit UvrA [Lignipirellula cremea]|uniref:UvrABC system protein A n=1 Tax=Lignipirellula cremea TaxID=2528010 RepID=A0A518DXA2_9BACT|nr:excinuclease ABC subunit UvrA [Lignipirellula cremea]QDU96452.1 UvrABC system protein A [Lignipirellula cremea]
MSARQIELRGVQVHNLKSIDLDIPHRQLIVVCGVSGSGKTSLALDTLYAEGQRRYIESFSAYTRQFLERLEKPNAERIDGVSPAIAVTRSNPSRNHRATVGAATEIADYLRLLMAKIGRVFCLECGVEIRRDSPRSVADFVRALPPGERLMVAFPVRLEARADENDDGKQPASEPYDPGPTLRALREDGFMRVAAAGQMVDLSTTETLPAEVESLLVIVDRLTSETDEGRLHDSLETAFHHGEGHCVLLLATAPPDRPIVEIDGRSWGRAAFSESLRCDACGIDYPTPEPRLYSFNSPLGACPVCEGNGAVSEVDLDLVIPNRQKTIRDGAIAPWNTAAYAKELESLLALAAEFDVPVDAPFADLNPQQLQRVVQGVPEKDFGGLDGFFAWLEGRKAKMHHRVFLNRWKSYHDCPACGGARLKPEALATRIDGRNMADLSRLQVDEAVGFFAQYQPDTDRVGVADGVLDQIRSRLDYLSKVGLGYVTLDRSLRSLSGGEAQRVALTSALGSNLVNMLYVLDEPTAGLHPGDLAPLLQAIIDLKNRGNTLVAVEHEAELIRAADQVIEIGPAAGSAGGRVVYQGSAAGLAEDPESITGAFLGGRRGVALPESRRSTNRGKVILRGARGRNLKNLSVEFPLGVLCLVTGVSGSGKSTLVQDTLYGALCQRFDKQSDRPLPYDDVVGDGQIDDVMLVDQTPIGRSPRSNPVTYIKAFDAIRAVFADTLEARTHNYRASHFSFNVEGGRCDACAGEGHIAIDMQFLADVYMRCPQCKATRFRKEILAVKYRGRNIAEVLQMTVREAFVFFRGQPKVQTRLKQLIDVGLDYLTLGQGANTLSTGEAQRLKLASYMSAATRNRTLFLLDEPTTGLHFADVVRLLDCFDALLAVGHSLIVVEHNLQLMKAADYMIDLGPGAAEQGGQVVFQGTPDEASECPRSLTGRYLAASLAASREGAMPLRFPLT